MRRVRVIGFGNPDAGDDSVGLLAVREARPMLEGPDGVEIVEAGAGLHILDLLHDVDAVVVVDAVRAPHGARPPGTIVRVEAGRDGLPAEVGSSLSSHGFGVGEAVGLAAALEGAPRVTLLGVEVADLTAGNPLSAAVAAALPELVALVVEEVGNLVSQ
ncbi:MAG TPA: hydrogenase maturation protease [Actinomycetota bacterium]|nr:hydrogenase maturation protease [Actinomycetota bacterium]